MANTKAARAIAAATAMWAVVGVLGGIGMAQEPARPHPATAPAPASATAALPTTSPAVMLEKGIYTEETVGDLDAAIKIYRQIVKDAKAARKYAAQAQYRLGMCYLKKGEKAKAEQALRELLAAYPQEKDVAGQAQKELAKLSPPAVSTAPRAVQTTPAALANDVDPSLDKITVTFDRPMMDKSWSWTGGGETFPERAGEISYDANRTTCTMPVKLRPGRVYWVGVNSPSHKNFTSADGTPAARYVILFATESADGKPTPLPEDLVKQATEINGGSGAFSELARDDGTSAGKRSIAGAAQGVKFQAPCDGAKIVAVRIYGSRYGTAQPPAENFRIWVADANSKQIAEFSLPYSKFERGDPAWVNLPVKPTEVPRTFSVFVDFDAQRTKGVYVHYDAAADGNSVTADRSGKVTPFRDGDWMIRAVVTSPRSGGNAAAGAAKTAISDQDRKVAENLSAEGWRLWGARKLPEAEAKFQAAVAKDPANANAWNGLGWAQMNQGKALNAKDSFEKAVAADPKLAGALNGLGWLAKGQGKTEEAVEYWKKAIAALPSATAALSGLAATYSELGQYDKAIEAYKQWLKAEPLNKDAKAALKKAQEAAEAMKAALPVAEGAALAWLALVDDAKYGDSWDAAAEFLRKAVAKDAFGKQIAAARTPLGKLLSRKLISATYMTSVPGAPDGQYVVIQFETSFENKKQAVETVTPMKDKDGKWRVSGYYIK
jgi:tetratricopeptide (TPR) repeat protein